MSEIASIDPIYSVKPEHVWLRITNCERPGKFQIILELNGGTQNGGVDKVLFESIDECDGLISQHTNLTWLLKEEK